jgi:hypothetical protein
MVDTRIAKRYRLNAGQYGTLLRLSAEELLHGPLPNDLEFLCRLVRPVANDINVITESLAQFFTLGEDNLWRSKLVVMRWKKRGE